ncbi:MAG: SPOR domain-containing protein [Sulfuricella sp.]|nr:SPOR domain-containing protein [Sulfuricella sp.]
MKWIFAILLMVNIAFFTVMQLSAHRAGEGARGHEPVQAEKIRLLPAPPAKAESAPPAQSAPNKPAEAAAEAKPVVCLEWGIFSGSDIKRAAQALDQLQLAGKLAQHPAAKADGYWVYFAPRKTLQEAQKKVEELKRLGVQDSAIMRDGSKWQYAVSLGVFSTEDAAAKYLGQLREKGVKTAVSAPRSHDTDGVVFQVRDSSDGVTAALTKLKLDFSGSELKATECSKTEGAAS